MQNINHGVSTGALFLLVGMIYERRHTREIAKLKGLQKVAPVFAAAFMVVMLSSIGVPGLNGFVGEFMVLIGSFATARWWVAVAAAGVILAALYLLWAYQRVFHGEPDEDNKSFAELKWKEASLLLPFIAIIVFTGVYPKPMLDRIEPSVDKLLAHVERQRLRTVGDRDPVGSKREKGDGRARSPTRCRARRSTGSRSARCWCCWVARWCCWSVGALTPPWPKRGYSHRSPPRSRSAPSCWCVLLWHRIDTRARCTLVGDALHFDKVGVWVTITICVGVFLAALVTDDYLRREGLDGPELYALYLLAASAAS